MKHHKPHRLSAAGSAALRLALLFTVLLGFLLVSCSASNDWVQFRGKEGRGATSRSLEPPLGIKWKFRLQLDGRTLHAFNPPVVKDGNIYFGSADGNFYALDIESGYMRWVFKSGASINSVPYADEDHVYFGSQDGKAYAVSRLDGSPIWSYQTGRPVNSTVQRYGNMVLFTSDGGASYFMTPEGAPINRIPNPVWYYHSYQMVDNVMYFAPGPLQQPHSFGPYDVKAGRYLWLIDTAEMGALWYSFPAIKGDLLFFSTAGYDDFAWDLKFHAYDRKTGKRLWKYQDFSRWGTSREVNLEELFRRDLNLLDFMAPSVWKDLVIYAGGDSVVRAFEARTGELVWEREFETPISSAPTVAGDRLYFGLLGDEPGLVEPQRRTEPAVPRLLCLSARNGKVLWKMDLEGAVLSAPVIAGKWLMFGTDKSMFYILEEVF